jgi:hypothetical protein
MKSEISFEKSEVSLEMIIYFFKILVKNYLTNICMIFINKILVL